MNQVKIQGSSQEMLASACELFLGKSEREIEKVAQETLEGHQRAIMGNMTVEVWSKILVIQVNLCSVTLALNSPKYDSFVGTSIFSFCLNVFYIFKDMFPQFRYTENDAGFTLYLFFLAPPLSPNEKSLRHIEKNGASWCHFKNKSWSSAMIKNGFCCDNWAIKYR